MYMCTAVREKNRKRFLWTNIDCFPGYIKLKRHPSPKKVQKSIYCVPPFMKEKSEIKYIYLFTCLCQKKHRKDNPGTNKIRDKGERH